MILTDQEIRTALETKQIFITPLPSSSDAFSSTSLDLTLDATIRKWNEPTKGVDQIICPGTSGYNYHIVAKNYTTDYKIDKDGFILEPQSFILAWTNEVVELPVASRLAARVEGKSSLARLGMGVHITAPIIHAGFKGPIQLEMFNHGNLRIKLTTGMSICQLVFELTLGTPQKGYSGQFLGQKKR